MLNRRVSATHGFHKTTILTAFAMGLALAAAPALGQTDTAGKKSAEPSTVEASGAESAAPQGENLKFNTDAVPKSTDQRPSMQFSDPGDAPLGTPRHEYAETTPEEAPFKTYVGYPKQLGGVSLEVLNLASAWSYQSNTYNFTSASTAIGLNYRLEVSPLWDMEVEYSHYSISMNAATVGTGINEFIFDSSSVSFDNYALKTDYCFISRTLFYRKLCPGFKVGNDGYPIVNFVGNSELSLTRIQDYIIGVSVLYQEPFSDKFLFKAVVGYNYGTGLGNSGYLTSSSDSSYYGDAGVEWTVSEHNLVTVMGEYLARNANVSGVRGSTKDSWQTNSSLIGGKIGYMRAF
jgi:hypothetical protein